MRTKVRLRLWAFAALLSMASPAAQAHYVRTGPAPADGLSIPSLTHGEMAVVADYRAAIFDAAAMQFPTDENFRRLFNFAKIQYTLCMWGLMPGSIRDEASPFNECSHAYLAATRAVLKRMLDMPGDKATARSLLDRMETDMIRAGAAFELCQYSGEPFNTEELIYPRWSGVPFHLPSLLGFGAFALALAGGGVLLRRWLRNCQVDMAASHPTGAGSARA